MSSRPIADYALLSDCHSAALVSIDGSVDWYCVPRFDGPSVFARLLDEDAGHWSIRPVQSYTSSRRYQGEALALETTFRTSEGEAVLTDVMPTGPNEGGHDLGAESPHALLRCLAVTEGTVEFELEFAPRMEYGLVFPHVQAIEGGALARGGATVLRLSSAVPLSLGAHHATARFTLRAGERTSFALQDRTSVDPALGPWSQDAIDQAVDDTVQAWTAWAATHTTYEGPWSDLVHNSGRMLWALTYYPTGALVAAPTTSLPESVGKSRNWDYRYCWIRDASLTLSALWIAACPDEALHYFQFLADVGVTEARAHGMQVMYGIGGEHDLHERELPHLSGWRDSRPVRVGNAAWEQDQLDVYGSLLDAAYRLRDQLDELDEAGRLFLARAADAAAKRWTEADHGIWEVRAEPRHYLHSKLMCWVALDRAVALADFLGAVDRIPEWERVRAEIRAAILEQGWNERVGAYTQSFGSDDLDASALLLALTGFVPARDPRMLATVRAIAEHLVDDRGLVRRYASDDGLEGEEGAFLLCTFWLAEVLATGGDIENARAMFEHAVSYANDVGLLSEEVSPRGELIGNFPQAFSHIGLVNAAWAIASAEGLVGSEPRCGERGSDDA